MATDVLYRTRPRLRPETAAWLPILVLAGVALAARLPQLFSPNLLLEGDECIVALMGLHLRHGHAVPLFMYGQHYGLAIVEVPVAALAFLFAGAGAVPLKLAMLAVWFAGVTCYFLAFSRVLGLLRALIATLLLVLMPAWAAMSMKAWSGYLTAFTAAGLVIHLVARRDDPSIGRWWLAGAATAIVFFAQPLWLPGLLPFVVYGLWSDRRPAASIGYGIAGAAAWTAIAGAAALSATGAVETWTRPAAGNLQLIASLPALARQIYVDLTGASYLHAAIPPGPVTAAVAATWMVVLAVAALLQIYRVVSGRYLIWSHLLFASASFTVVANWVLLDVRDARYLLALDAPLVYLAAVEVSDLIDRHVLPRRLCVAIVALFAAAQVIAMSEFARYTFMWWSNAPNAPSESRSLQHVFGYLRSRGVAHAYALNPLLQWTVSFYSGETVVARWKADRDRYPPYIDAVDGALAAGAPVAVVGYAAYSDGLERLVPDPEAITVIDGKYLVYVGADRALLRRAGFHLTR